MRFVGIKNYNIELVSDKIFENEHLQVVELPTELNNISAIDLISKYKYKNNEFINKSSQREVSKLKIAFISNYYQQCGISTYGESLFPEIYKQAGDYKIFAEEHDNLTNKNINDKIVYCWKRGESLLRLIYEIKLYDPDIVFINHEWGLFPNARSFLALLSSLSNFRIITLLHSIFPEHYDKSIVENALPEIVVHLEEAKKALINKGNSSKIHVIPHGCYEINNINKLWNFYRSNHTFIQAGFLFKYKNYEDSIIATSILKKKYNDVFFTAIGSESPFCLLEHDRYHQELLELISGLDVEENVAIIRGYQTDLGLDSYLRTNQACVLPYRVADPSHKVFGASGFARLMMSKGLPVITSSIPHFSDLPTIKANSPEEIAEKLDAIYSNEAFKNNQINSQIDFVKDNSFANIAAKYIEIFENK